MSSHAPRRIVSLQPSVTSVMERLGALDRLVACTKWCAEAAPAVRSLPVAIVEDSWTASADAIRAAGPDLVIASVPYRMESLAEILRSGLPVLALAPRSLADVYGDVALIAGALHLAERAEAVVETMRAEIDCARARAERHLAASGRTRPRVYCEEWGKPPIHSQPWVAELVEAAGGVFLGTAGARTTTEAVAAAAPDVIVTAWCGAGDRVPLERIVSMRGWESLEAVRSGRVFCIRDELLNTPAPTLLGGLHALASAILPEAFGPAAEGLRRIGSEAAGPAPEGAPVGP